MKVFFSCFPSSNGIPSLRQGITGDDVTKIDVTFHDIYEKFYSSAHFVTRCSKPFSKTCKLVQRLRKRSDAGFRRRNSDKLDIWTICLHAYSCVACARSIDVTCSSSILAVDLPNSSKPPTSTNHLSRSMKHRLFVESVDSAKMNVFFPPSNLLSEILKHQKTSLDEITVSVIMFKRQTTAFVWWSLLLFWRSADWHGWKAAIETALRLLPIWQIRDYWTKVSTYFIQTTSALNEWHAIFCKKNVFDTLALSSASCSNVFTVWTVNHSNWHVSFNTFCICICIILM